MSYSAITVANAFLTLARRENKTLTNMKLQKLVYIAQGFSLAMLGRPLFRNPIHAFQYGPVIPFLYEELKRYGNGSIANLIPIPDGEDAIDVDDPTCIEATIIRGVWERYGTLSAVQLSNITHQPETPWSKVWNKKNYEVIPNGLIQNHYLNLLEKA
jgi:uncharacterized phage-associated protein